MDGVIVRVYAVARLGLGQFARGLRSDLSHVRSHKHVEDSACI